MFTLAYIDLLTPGRLVGNLRVAGTGAIGNDGVVAPVSNVDIKVAAALLTRPDVVFTPTASSSVEHTTTVESHHTRIPADGYTVAEWLNVKGYEQAGRDAARRPGTRCVRRRSRLPSGAGVPVRTHRQRGHLRGRAASRDHSHRNAVAQSIATTTRSVSTAGRGFVPRDCDHAWRRRIAVARELGAPDLSCASSATTPAVAPTSSGALASTASSVASTDTPTTVATTAFSTTPTSADSTTPTTTSTVASVVDRDVLAGISMTSVPPDVIVPTNEASLDEVTNPINGRRASFRPLPDDLDCVTGTTRTCLTGMLDMLGFDVTSGSRDDQERRVQRATAVVQLDAGLPDDRCARR